MKYHSERKDLLDLCKHSQAITRRRKKQRRHHVKLDVRSLDEREKTLNTRKWIREVLGHSKKAEGLQLPLFGLPVYNESTLDPDNIEPEYIKKYKNVMK